MTTEVEKVYVMPSFAPLRYSLWLPGFYKDTTNGDLWRLDIIDGRESWGWVNGPRYRFVPREHLKRLEPWW